MRRVNLFAFAVVATLVISSWFAVGDKITPPTSLQQHSVMPLIPP